MKLHLLYIVFSISAALILSPAPVRAEPVEVPVEGYAFLDANRDGLRQPEEAGIGDVSVQVTSLTAGTQPLVLVTGPDGYYQAGNLVPDTYRIEAEPPLGYRCGLCQADVALGEEPLVVDLALVLDDAGSPTPTPAPTHTPLPLPTPGYPVITFYVEPGTTRFPGDCATLRWWVDRATEVFLMLPNGQIGVEGAGEYQVCPQTTTSYHLKVNGQNGSQEIIDALVLVSPPPTSTLAPTPRPPKPKPLPTYTPAPTFTPTATFTPTPAPTATPTPLPSPTPTPPVDPLLAGLPVRWGTLEEGNYDSK